MTSNQKNPTVPLAAAEALEVPRSVLDALLAELQACNPSSDLVADLTMTLSAPVEELWAVFQLGTNVVWPCLSREHAEFVAANMTERATALLKEQGNAFKVKHQIIPSPWTRAEHFEELAIQMVDEAENFRQTAIRATQERDKALRQARNGAPA